MTDELVTAALTADSEELQFELAQEDGIGLAEGDAYVYPSPVMIGEHEVFAVTMVAGDLHLGLVSDMKLHKLEIVKGMPTKAAVRPIRKTTTETPA